MSAQHTQGKLKVVSTYAIPEIRDQEDHFVFAAGSASPQSFVNARRLAACWNACEGLPTEKLEISPIFDVAMEAKRYLASVEKQRDELLEALREMAERIEDHPAYEALTEEEEDLTGGDTAELSYLARVGRTAIAKAEGGEE